LDYACEQPIDLVMVNTNGVRIASDARLREQLHQQNRRCEVYLQFDGFSDDIYNALRGQELLETKLKAIELLGEIDVRVTLVCTVEAGVNFDQLGKIVRFAMERPWVTGVSFQPATYVGRHVLPETLHQRVTFPDVIRGIVEQSAGTWRPSDFLPLPCAHPNAHSLAYAYREGAEAVPLTRLINIVEHLDLLANGITFNRASARELISEFLSRQSCGCNGDCRPILPSLTAIKGPSERESISEKSRSAMHLGEAFFRRCLQEDLSPADVFRITTTSFMDAYNFDVRQLMKSCVHHLLPTGHLIPFCAYNLLYRDGHVPLPELAQPRAAAVEPMLVSLSVASAESPN
jgi:7,8-dihydro-6-hydroxymethylpterin dimethyltransferase